MKSPVKSISLNRAEGPTQECGPRPLFKSFSEANADLSKMSCTAPLVGYDKVDFSILWENGERYDGRYDLSRDSDCLIEGQAKRFCESLLGLRCPEGMDQSRYEAMLSTNRMKAAAESVRSIYEGCSFE